MAHFRTGLRHFNLPAGRIYGYKWNNTIYNLQMTIYNF
jgi:hypothetical protein